MKLPDDEDRLLFRGEPRRNAVGSQRWNDLLFLHWQMDPEVIQASLPAGLYVDVFQGKGWLGIVPFFMERIRPAWLPPLPWLSWFMEMNLRTYVHDDRGRPGVWFYSLDCNQPVAVALARRFFDLPYFHARMTSERRQGRIHFACQRKGAEQESRFVWRPHSEGHEAIPGTLEFFLVERYLLFASGPQGVLRTGRVHHRPYQISTPELTAWDNAPALQSGFALSGPPQSVLCAGKVDVRIFALE